MKAVYLSHQQLKPEGYMTCAVEHRSRLKM